MAVNDNKPAGPIATGSARMSDGSMNVTTERTGEGAVYRAEPRAVATEHTLVESRTTATPNRDTLRWGPVLAGLMTTIASMLFLTVLGLAVGLSALEPGDSGRVVGTSAAIWSAISALISFLLGGWVAGRTAGIYKPEHALLNGFMVGATALALILWLISSGVGNLFGTLGTNIGDIAQLGAQTVDSTDVNNAQNAAQNAADTVRSRAVDSYDEARNSAWGTLGGLALALGAATVGGLAGFKSKSRREGDLEDSNY